MERVEASLEKYPRYQDDFVIGEMYPGDEAFKFHERQRKPEKDAGRAVFFSLPPASVFTSASAA